ncbi:MAG TPA: hypothetical protein VKE27_08975 [Candidatus Dormibacteraeota bacterium]|nr:hypothetical protein [Candidatus Dormibacteraeota bacterium]
MSSGDVADIREWIAVYRELCGFKENLLRELETQRDKVRPHGQPELENDRKLLEREAVRLNGRLEFWERRLGSGGRS